MSLLEKEGQLAQLQQQLETCEDSARRLQLEQEINALSHEMYHDLNAWDRVYLARHPQRFPLWISCTSGLSTSTSLLPDG